MKALSLKQPWLWWVMQGMKTLETRTWTTKHRGPLLLCASQSVDWGAVTMAAQRSIPCQTQPLGHAVGVVDVIDCRPMTKEDEAAAMCDWDDRRHVFVLANPRAILPVPVKGSLGLFEVNVPIVFQAVTAP